MKDMSQCNEMAQKMSLINTTVCAISPLTANIPPSSAPSDTLNCSVHYFLRISIDTWLAWLIAIEVNLINVVIINHFFLTH